MAEQTAGEWFRARGWPFSDRQATPEFYQFFNGLFVDVGEPVFEQEQRAHDLVESIIRDQLYLKGITEQAGCGKTDWLHIVNALDIPHKQRSIGKILISCVFHQERTPSLVLYPKSGHACCYGCGNKTDAAEFLFFLNPLRETVASIGLEQLEEPISLLEDIELEADTYRVIQEPLDWLKWIFDEQTEDI